MRNDGVVVKVEEKLSVSNGVDRCENITSVIVETDIRLTLSLIRNAIVYLTFLSNSIIVELNVMLK